MKAHVHQLIVVSDVTLMASMGERFLKDRMMLFEEAFDSPEDDDEEVRELVKKSLWDDGSLIRLFQRSISELMEVYRNPFMHEEVIEDITLGREDGDLTDIINIVAAFEQAHPDKKVLNLVPIDFKGTLGFVVSLNA